MGRLELIAGCMFSGKTTELFRRMRLAHIARPNEGAVLYKPSLDTRSEETMTHDGLLYTSVICPDASSILRHLQENMPTSVIGIDEAQFFDDEIVRVCLHLRSDDYRVIATGLNQDFRGEPFRFRDSQRHIGSLLALADDLLSLNALCMYPQDGSICGASARYTQRLFLDGQPVPYDDPLVHPGGKDPKNDRRYEARCFHHHAVPGRPW